MLADLLTAIHSRLTGDAGLTAVVPASRIGNHIKDDAGFPNIDWRLENVEGAQVKGEESYNGDLVIEVNSDYRGDLEVYQIQGLIYTALSSALTVSGADNPFMSFNSISVDTDGDNRLRTATINYTFHIGPE